MTSTRSGNFKFEKMKTATLNGIVNWRRQKNKRKYKKSETVKEWCMISIEVKTIQRGWDRKDFK